MWRVQPIINFAFTASKQFLCWFFIGFDIKIEAIKMLTICEYQGNVNWIFMNSILVGSCAMLNFWLGLMDGSCIVGTQLSQVPRHQLAWRCNVKGTKGGFNIRNNHLGVWMRVFNWSNYNNSTIPYRRVTNGHIRNWNKILMRHMDNGKINSRVHVANC